MQVASENAEMGHPEAKMGITPAFSGSMRLTRLLGRNKALELLLTGNRVDAREAHRLGLVNHVVASSELIPRSMKLLHQISKKSPRSIAAIINRVNKYCTTGIDHSPDLEEFMQAFETDDFKEGLAAFLEGRKAHFLD